MYCFLLRLIVLMSFFGFKLAPMNVGVAIDEDLINRVPSSYFALSADTIDVLSTGRVAI